MSTGSNTMIVGGTFNYQNHTSRGMDTLKERVATDAFHNSGGLYDAPKCHPHTRVAVLDDIMQWVDEGEDFMMWLFGPAGAGKSAIAKRIAEIAAEKDLLIADFFFSKSSSTRNTTDRFIATLAYQLAISIPDTRSSIEDAIEQDPVIFHKSIPTQIDALLLRPLQSVSSTRTFPCQKLIIIDGLDECTNSQAQVAILEAISRSFPQHDLPIKFLLVSRPEPDLVTLFNCNEQLKSNHRRLALDDTYKPDDDIRRFFSDKFEQIRLTHPLRSTIPISWPTQEILKKLVAKSSGQFIYASTVVKFVESNCHQPPARLKIILGLSPPGNMNPFAELDALYSHLFSSVDNIQFTLRVLSFYVMTPRFASLIIRSIRMLPEQFLCLGPGDIQLALINLSSILTYHESSGIVNIQHASLVDFLSDKRRSTTFYIDKASTCTYFIHRILECVKGPDGIRAGDISLFQGVHDPELSPLLYAQLQSDISNFDLDAFINASVRCYYKEHRLPIPGSTTKAFKIWKTFLIDAGRESDNKALERLNKSFESRLQIYQSDWRLKLLPTLVVTIGRESRSFSAVFPFCRYMDILLEMDNHYLHIVDQNALDLRHGYYFGSGIRSYADGDAYASVALHCMRFLSNPPKYCDKYEGPETGLIITYGHWKMMCSMTLELLSKVLRRANTLPELVQFICNHDIHPAIQKILFDHSHQWEVNAEVMHEFLNRAIQRFCNITDPPVSGDLSSVQWHEYHEIRSPPDLFANQHFFPIMCCSNVHRYSS